ncbi:MAG: sulfatase-like hydrolase/transferase [Pirellulaceae bacterium]
MKQLSKQLALALFLTGIAASAVHADRPHVILVMADDQGWGDTGYNGHPVVKTPNLDAMAEDGLVFNRFYAAAPVCSPTRGSVLTGRHPTRIKITNHGRYMRPQETTIAEALRDAGYVTGMFGKWHVGSAQKDSPVNPGNSGFDEWVIGLNFFDNDPFLSRNGVVEQIKGSGSEITIDETISFLRKHRDDEKPMFAIAWFPSPHDPHLEKPSGPDPYEGVKGADYFREITVLDHAFGRLRQELRTLGIARDTIVWYCSDNGGLREESSGGR